MPSIKSIDRKLVLNARYCVANRADMFFQYIEKYTQQAYYSICNDDMDILIGINIINIFIFFNPIYRDITDY